MMFYYVTPYHSVALNAKVGSSSMARAIIQQFYPRQDWLIKTAAYPAGKSPETQQWHWMCAGQPQPDKPVVLLVRDPVARFVSACQQVGIRQDDIDSAITSLVNDTAVIRSKPADVSEKDWAEKNAQFSAQCAKIADKVGRRLNETIRPGHLRDNVHFFHQHKYAVGPTTCFQFPRDIDAAAKFIGIEAPIPASNKARREKAILSSAQENAVRDYYALDQQLFECITAPEYIFEPEIECALLGLQFVV